MRTFREGSLVPDPHAEGATNDLRILLIFWSSNERRQRAIIAADGSGLGGLGHRLVTLDGDDADLFFEDGHTDAADEFGDQVEHGGQGDV
jgi:hypothetical protein